MNIFTKYKPKMVNIDSIWLKEKRVKAKGLLIEYQEVFSWGYEDLKTFRNGEFKNKIHLKPDASPFRKKQCNYNPMVFDASFREVHKMMEVKLSTPYIIWRG